jgi:hypothetical protein
VLVKLNATNQGLSKLEGTMAQTLELTAENVEKVLNELRPYLQADGGNVELVEIDGPVVKLRLQGPVAPAPVLP